MSRIGKRPVALPSGVSASTEGGALMVKGPKGTLQLPADYPVVLVGVSRGAGLSVVAAGQCGLRPDRKSVV